MNLNAQPTASVGSAHRQIVRQAISRQTDEQTDHPETSVEGEKVSRRHCKIVAVNNNYNEMITMKTYQAPHLEMSPKRFTVAACSVQ